MPRTLAQKILGPPRRPFAPGEPDLLYVDLHLIHEVTTPRRRSSRSASPGAGSAGRPHRRHDGPHTPTVGGRAAADEIFTI